MKRIIAIVIVFFFFFNANDVFASKKIINENLSEINNLPMINYLKLENKKTYQKEIILTNNDFGMLDLLIKMQDLDDDGIIFRIKEAGLKDWYYESFYDAEFFDQNLYYSFGFKPFSDSSEKKYIIEIEPIDENQNNSIKLFLVDENEENWTWRAAKDQDFKETLKNDFMNEWKNKISTQKPFFIFWLALLGINTGAILLSIFWPFKKKSCYNRKNKICKLF